MTPSSQRRAVPEAGEFGRVAVLLGGNSAEREISLLSGNAVLGALRRNGVDAHAFDPAERPLVEFVAERYDRAFIVLHGRGGEDGTIQGALEMLAIPYTGSGVLGSALSLDKWRTKRIWRACGIPTPAALELRGPADFDRALRTLGLPLVVKPAHEGSTIGLTKVVSAADLPAAYALARDRDRDVLAEQFVAGQELTASILDGMALPLVRIEAPDGNYDYRNKYFSDATRYHCPCGLPAPLESAIRNAALEAFEALGCSGWGRADLIVRADETYQFLEMNTCPGMTAHSLVPMAARAVGIEFDELVLRILAAAPDPGARR
jgi:D-alanine-D-alanine ligase